jgi:hypothetical protein
MFERAIAQGVREGVNEGVREGVRKGMQPLFNEFRRLQDENEQLRADNRTLSERIAALEARYETEAGSEPDHVRRGWVSSGRLRRLGRLVVGNVSSQAASPAHVGQVAASWGYLPRAPVHDLRPVGVRLDMTPLPAHQPTPAPLTGATSSASPASRCCPHVQTIPFRVVNPNGARSVPQTRQRWVCRSIGSEGMGRGLAGLCGRGEALG